MKRIRRIAIVLLAVVSVYATWILLPHFGMVEVTDNVGLSQADVQYLVRNLKSEKAFYGRGEIGTILSSALAPWTRPSYFIEISGNLINVVITAGYVRGELWAGGPILRAKKIDGMWHIEKSTMLWRS